MAISDKTRKTLWARSGNRCAMCRTELVAERNDHARNLNIGDECHIISEQLNGPRHLADYNKDYDDYENLILLCKNHHKTIDELWETYTIDLLRTFKANHEKWIVTVIDNAKNQEKQDKVVILPRLKTGKQLINIVIDSHAYKFDHDEFKSQEEADFVSAFLQNLQDLGELSGFVDFEIGKQIELGFNLNKEIEALDRMGFYVFGERKKSRITNGNKDDFGVWNVATLIVLRKDNPAIIDDEKLVAQI